MTRAECVLAACACVMKIGMTTAYAHGVDCSHLHDKSCAESHLFHGRGSAGDFLPEPGSRFAMGAAAEVATVPLVCGGGPA